MRKQDKGGTKMISMTKMLNMVRPLSMVNRYRGR